MRHASFRVITEGLFGCKGWSPVQLALVSG
jgi:hypothetical protein